MKTTRSALKSLIKEEMNRINEAPTRISDEDGMHFSPPTRISDEDGMHFSPSDPQPLMPSEFAEYADTKLVWTQDDLGEAGVLTSGQMSVHWPTIEEGFMGGSVTIVFPLNDEERRITDAPYTGKSRNISLFSTTAAMSAIRTMVKNQHPNLFDAMKIASEGSDLIEADKAIRVDGGWIMAPARDTMTRSGATRISDEDGMHFSPPK